MLRQPKATAPRTTVSSALSPFFCAHIRGGAMATRLAPGQAYAGRREDVCVINCTVDRDAATLLRYYSGGKKLGTFVSRLVHEYHSKQQERQRVQEALQSVLEEKTQGG